MAVNGEPQQTRIMTYFRSMLTGACNTLQSPASAIQERMEIFKAPKSTLPDRDDLVAVVAETTRPARGDASDVIYSFVYACCSKIECCDGV